MGVLKLWELLLTIAQPCQIQQLSGKVLAIDASIWIVKIDSLYNSNTQKIKSILSKIMLLKRNNILPIFVFDGVAPVLKRRTLQERNRRRLINNQLEAKKRSEIQIMRMIEGDSSRQSQKSHKTKKNQQQLSELNKTLGKLSELREEQEVNTQLLQKIALQSEILNTKYKIILEITPEFRKWSRFIENSEFNELDLEDKIQYLDEMEEYSWKSIKRQWRADKKNDLALTQQQKLRQDLEIIQKRSIIREMQDNLFRKMMQKNTIIEDGHEIIETIYNGRKVIQKRKILEKNSACYGLGHLRKGKMKNDVSSLNFNQANNKGSDAQQQEQQDEFIAAFCTNIAPKNKMPAVQEPVEVQTPSNESSYSLKAIPKKPKKAKKLNKNKNDENSKQQSQQIYPGLGIGLIKINQDEPENYVNQGQLNKKIEREKEEQTDNKDNLPNFVPKDQNQYLNYSNDNLELQNLFSILGLPFLIAPSEAEAQCAALQLAGIVDGIVTEDSDTFLFGGKNVYRGVFQNNIRHYSYHKMQQKLKMNRQKLIIFAMLLGSDYTDGVKGVGLVNAMQILKVFNTFDKLQKFKRWAQHPDIFLPEEETTSELMKSANQQEKQFYELHRKFKNYWQIGESFSSDLISRAYLKPEVVPMQQLRQMTATGQFKDKQVKRELLQKILKQKLQLQSKQYEHFMKLLTIRFKDKQENTLLNYVFKKTDNQELARIKSKRLQKSIEGYPQ